MVYENVFCVLFWVVNYKRVRRLKEWEYEFIFIENNFVDVKFFNVKLIFVVFFGIIEIWWKGIVVIKCICLIVVVVGCIDVRVVRLCDCVVGCVMCLLDIKIRMWNSVIIFLFIFFDSEIVVIVKFFILLVLLIDLIMICLVILVLFFRVGVKGII